MFSKAACTLREARPSLRLKADSQCLKLLIMPEMSLNGALVLSRSGRDEDIPAETLQRFKTAIKNHGYDPEDSCVFDNSDCNKQ